jgi:hypothetical protein
MNYREEISSTVLMSKLRGLLLTKPTEDLPILRTILQQHESIVSINHRTYFQLREECRKVGPLHSFVIALNPIPFGAGL